MSKRKFAIELRTCNERYPGASLYIACKKSALKKAKGKNTIPGKAIAACKRFMVAASFDPKGTVPFFINNGSLYFSGVGLNKTIPVKNLDPPNFDCESVPKMVKNTEKAQYILFGNHPRTFSPLERVKGKALKKALRFKKPSKKGFDVPGFGRLFGKPTNSSGVVFFPSANCDFDAQLGKTYSGLSAFYLLDEANGSVSPYFGIAYYQSDQKKTTTKELIKKVKENLGTSFQTFSKNRNVTFIAATDVSETDAEQDPKNLCRKPRRHQVVAVVQGKKDAPNKPDYLIMANIKNLCDYGDRLAKRITR